jgi:hypothetical protein
MGTHAGEEKRDAVDPGKIRYLQLPCFSPLASGKLLMVVLVIECIRQRQVA